MAWLTYVGTKLYKSDRNYSSTDAGGPLWKEPSGFSQAIWNFWKTRWNYMAVAKYVIPKVRQLAERGVTIRNTIERTEATLIEDLPPLRGYHGLSQAIADLSIAQEQ